MLFMRRHPYPVREALVAAGTGYTRETVKTWLKHLRKRGLVERVVPSENSVSGSFIWVPAAPAYYNESRWRLCEGPG